MKNLFQLLFFSLSLLFSSATLAQSGGELHFCLHAEPKTFNPILVDDEASETIRYLTGGVLLRLNRHTQMLEPELAESWKVTEKGRRISFRLRPGVRFSDGTAFSAEDVAFTMRSLMDPQLHSPTGDSFRSGEGQLQINIADPLNISLLFPSPVAGLDRLFDQVAIVSAHSPKKEMSVLGPFYVSDYKPAQFVLLARNPNYWKRDAAGNSLPYLDSLRLDIQRNRDIELLRFRRGEIQLINSLDAEYFDRLSQDMPGVVHDSGPGLDSEQMWFNQVPTSPLPDFKKAWFHSTAFRVAISKAISREDIVRVVFAGHAQSSYGPVSPANHFWFNAGLPAPKLDQAEALRLLEKAGFRQQGDTLRDSAGHAVEFSLATNSGNKLREQMSAMIQQDLAQIGIKVSIVTLDFPSLIERMTRTFNYEACLLGLVNDDLDPTSQMNVWLSSASNHQWYPNEPAPSTAWEAEIDHLMKEQASELDPKKRKKAFDRVQQIVSEQQPFIYLINKNALSALSPNVIGSAAVALHPHTFWNVDALRVSSNTAEAKR